MRSVASLYRSASVLWGTADRYSEGCTDRLHGSPICERALHKRCRASPRPVLTLPLLHCSGLPRLTHHPAYLWGRAHGSKRMKVNGIAHRHPAILGRPSVSQSVAGGLAHRPHACGLTDRGQRLSIGICCTDPSARAHDRVPRSIDRACALPQPASPSPDLFSLST